MFSKVKDFWSNYKDRSIKLWNNFKIFLDDTRYKFNNLYETNHKNGMMHLKKGHLWDAFFRFKIIKKFWPAKLEDQYYYAYCLALMKKPDQAKFVLEKIKNDYPEANVLIEKINKSKIEDLLKEYDDFVKKD